MRRLGLILLCVFMLFSTGCWDRNEIDRNFFVSTIAVDAGKDINDKKILKDAKPEDPFGERNIERLQVTYAFPDISGYSAQKSQIPSDKFIKTEAYSMEDAMSNAILKSSRNIDIGHASLLLISSDVFQNSKIVKEIVDYLSRNPMINRRMYVAVAEGSAEQLVKYPLNMESTIGAYVNGLMESSKKNAVIIPMTLNEFTILLGRSGNAIVPNLKVDSEKKEIKINGISIIKNYVIKGTLNPQETSAIEILRGKLISGKKVIYYNDEPIDMEIDNIKRKIKLTQEADKLNINVLVEIEGKVKQYTTDKNLLDGGFLDKLQNYYAESISTEGKEIFTAIQREYGVDLIGIREYVEKFKPSMWRKVENNWEETYKSANMNLDVRVELRRIGIKK
ncbi:Ger(x)C family spore germination protein [Clostridium sp. 19966]|uniref:Ger(x)C family spore germination protein n=1 Tax=Clostridium sp. 19966 TaxID=2768166 RepID=UPI0028DFCC72|nr:Ger(x)C family spore germination protein [Clostridium sp. 19966]MDT8715612.1 Ger(x)C family spore germination protein [Clostridium sp. 19966]